MFGCRDIPSKLSGLFIKSGLALVRKVGISSPWACAWGIHPGGKAIIKAFRTAFAALRISPDGLDCSEEVLRDYGNMSSATIFFVLQVRRVACVLFHVCGFRRVLL
jgi:alkylresorcinol/alkylpyrone synthase